MLTVAVAGATASIAGIKPVTVMVVEPVNPPEMAWTTVLPVDNAETRPLPLTDAIEGFEELQVAVDVTSCELPSE